MAKRRLAPNAGQKVSTYIKNNLSGTLTSSKLDELCGTQSSDEQYNGVVAPLISDKVIEPKGTTLARGSEERPIYQSYRITAELPEILPASGHFMHGNAPAKAAVPPELLGFNPLLLGNDFLEKHLKVAEAWRPELVQLSAWLDAHGEDNPAPAAYYEERSFEIFRNEKLIVPRSMESRAGWTLWSVVRSIGLTDALNVSESPSVLHYYVPEVHAKALTVLIVENRCPFTHVQEALGSGVRTIFGERIDGVVYGEGFNASAEGVLASTEKLFAGGAPVKYLYWGDIDRQGIMVYEQLKEADVHVEPLMAAYRAMIDAAVGLELPEAGTSAVPTHCGIDIAMRLDVLQLETFMRVIAASLRIPQEIVPTSSYASPSKAPSHAPTRELGRRRWLPWARA